MLSREQVGGHISEIVNATDPFKIKPHAEAIMAHDAALRARVAQLEAALKELANAVIEEHAWALGSDQQRQAEEKVYDLALITLAAPSTGA